ncbi:hypothetical protein CHARACLAT_013350 [Characodon lateralis]|uniref:Uncharacterized protein n=1 Tax=Characodon lateralis TaxID=208331 RepID=A0ABU7E1V5_9TELE|nr:hypothetical protein [Characodon lateralis]
MLFACVGEAVQHRSFGAMLQRCPGKPQSHFFTSSYLGQGQPYHTRGSEDYSAPPSNSLPPVKKGSFLSLLHFTSSPHPFSLPSALSTPPFPWEFGKPG